MRGSLRLYPNRSRRTNGHAPTSIARGRRLNAPLLSIPCVAAVVVAGVWVTGGVISNNFRTSMALTAAWFALSGTACLAIGVRSRRFRLP